MSLLFDWYTSPEAGNETADDKKLYPRVCLRNRAGTDFICEQIEQMTTASRADIKLVLAALSHVVGWSLRYGYQVHLEGLGYFNVTLTTDEPVYESTKYKTQQVRIAGIKFLPDKEMRTSLGNVEVERLATFHSQKLTDGEIDQRLTAHFARQSYLTRREFEQLCTLTRPTANRYLRRLIDDGKLKARGATHHPVYLPAPGHYGAPAEATGETEDRATTVT